jgi:hypothetical protein
MAVGMADVVAAFAAFSAYRARFTHKKIPPQVLDKVG